jgi:pimeloyl-ACP methyl ester carboxylesterase
MKACIKSFLLCVIVMALIIINSCAWIRGYEFMYGHNNYVEHKINIRGIRLYYEIYGKGEPLFLLHPNGGSIENFSNQIAYFSKYYQVIAVDSRAQGRSMDKDDSLSYEMMVDDFKTLLDTLHLDSCNILGWSDGGINGLLLAIHYPQKVKKMVIVSANLWPDTSAIDPFAYNWAKNYNDTLELLIKECQNKKYNDTIEKQLRLIRLKYEKKIKHLLTYEPHISLEQIKQIKIPALIVAGDHDIIKLKHTLLISETIPNSCLFVIPSCGHSIPIEHSKIFNATALRFLKGTNRKIEGFDRFR